MVSTSNEKFSGIQPLEVGVVFLWNILHQSICDFLESKGNFSGFFDENQTHVLIPLELELITSPSRFKVLYYSLVIYGDTPVPMDNNDEGHGTTISLIKHVQDMSCDRNMSKIVVDLSSWIDMPPPTYSFLTTPSLIEIVRGEEKEVGIQLVSSSGTLPNFLFA